MSLSYETLKRLDQAGFPLEKLEDIRTNLPDGTIVYKREFVYGYMVPTLEELIQECEKICGDSLEIKWNKTDDGRYFVLTNKEDLHGNVLEFWIPSLKEVFAYLYIELKEKDA